MLTKKTRGTWLAQLVEHVPLNLGVMSLSPTLGIELEGRKKGGREKKKGGRKEGKEKEDKDHLLHLRVHLKIQMNEHLMIWSAIITKESQYLNDPKIYYANKTRVPQVIQT